MGGRFVYAVRGPWERESTVDELKGNPSEIGVRDDCVERGFGARLNTRGWEIELFSTMSEGR